MVWVLAGKCHGYKMNINHYILCKKEVIELFHKQTDPDILQSISLISVCLHVPCIAVSFFVGEALGWPEEIVDSIERLTKSYSYKNIEGIPEGYPGKKL